MLMIDSAKDLVRYWQVREVMKNTPEVLETTSQCARFAYACGRQNVPSEILAVPELHRAWLRGWRSAVAEARRKKH